MHVQVINRQTSVTFNPLPKTIIIRITSDDSFYPMENDSLFEDKLELYFDDVSLEQAEENRLNDESANLHGAMTIEHFNQIKSFIVKNKHMEHLIVHCDAGASRSPAVALGILDYILEDHEQAKKMVDENQYYPNAHVMSFFKNDYYNGYFS